MAMSHYLDILMIFLSRFPVFLSSIYHVEYSILRSSFLYRSDSVAFIALVFF